MLAMSKIMFEVVALGFEGIVVLVFYTSIGCDPLKQCPPQFDLF
jgi:hypothetical protein